MPGEAVSAGVETRNAKVADGAGEGVPGGVDEGDGVPLVDGEGLGVGLGVWEGIMFSQRCNGTLAPPIWAMSSSMTMRPMASMGWRTVVRGGSVHAISAESS